MGELTHRVVACTYVFRGDKMLLLKRATRPFTLAPPGGRLEPLEDPFAGALREVREESGLEVEIFGVAQAWFGSFVPGAFPILSINYLARSDAGTPRLSDEHTEYVWVTRKMIESREIETQDEQGSGFSRESILDAFERYEAWMTVGKL